MSEILKMFWDDYKKTTPARIKARIAVSSCKCSVGI